jgi:uncharacterized phage protein (TIGR02218 family)
MALAIKVTSKAEFGSAVVAFTTNTRNTTLPGHGGVTFYSAPAVTPTIVEQSLDEASQLEMTGVYTSNGFAQADVVAGKWNFAEIEVFTYCWSNTSLGELLHFKGNLGEVRDFQTYFTCEGRGLIGKLSQEVEKVTSRLCRVKEFRDAECGHSASTVVISSVTYNITQTGVRTNADWTQSTTLLTVRTSDMTGNIPPEDFYRNGKITMTTGANSGVSREIAYSSAASGGNIEIQLKRPFPYNMTNGDRAFGTLVAGCNRTIEDCMKFTNITRRRAEDFVPGLEAVNRLPQQA